MRATLLILIALCATTSLAGDSFEALIAEARLRVDGAFGDGTWDTNDHSRALVSKAELARVTEAVVNAQSLGVTVTVPGQGVHVPGVDLRSPKLNEDNCQANLPNCPDCEWWNAPCHVAKGACELGKGAAQAACAVLNVAKGAISDKKLAHVEFPNAHVEADVSLSGLRLSVAPTLQNVAVSGNVDGAAHIQTGVSLQPEPLVVLAGCFKTDMYLHRTRVQPAERTLTVSAELTPEMTRGALHLSYKIPEMKVKVRVDQMVYPKLLKDNVHAAFTCPHLVSPNLLLIGALSGDLFTYEHELKVHENSGRTDVLRFQFDLPGETRTATMIGGERWLGVQLEP